MSRLDQLQENSVVSRLHAARLAFDSLKRSQRAGSANVGIKRIVSGNNIDFTTTIAYHQVRIWEITVIPTDSTFVNSTFVWRMFYNVITTTGTGTTQTYTEDIAPDPDGRVRNRLYFMGTTPSASVTYGIRVISYVIGNATLSIVQIA